MDNTEALKRLVEPTLEAMGFELVRVMVTGSQRATVQVMIERADRQRLTVEHCAQASRVISAVLDVEDPISGTYTLEVSSPGIDRPLTRLADFQRFAGHVARLELDRPLAGRRRFKGRLAGVEGEHVLLDPADEAGADQAGTAAAPLSLPYDAIQRAKLVLTDELVAAAGGVG